MSDEKNVTTITSGLPDPIALAKEAWEIFAARFWTMIGIGIVGLLAIVVVVFLLIVIGAFAFFGLGAKPSPQVIGIEVIIGIIGILVVLALGQWLTGAAILSIIDWDKKEGMKSFIGRARPFILPLLGTTILFSILSIGAFAFFIIPVLIFSIWFMLFRYIIVGEKKSGLLALHTSREYVRGRFWGVLWRVIAISIPMYILGLIVSRTGHDAGPVQGLYQLVSLLLVPFYSCYYYVLLTHLRKGVTPPTVVPTKSKVLYLVIPLLGYLLVIATGIIVVPQVIKALQSLSAGIPGNESQLGGTMKINPSTGIVYGLTTYYLTNKKFPDNLQVLVNNHILTSIPVDTKTGLPYRYTAEKNGLDFKLCTPISVKPEKCVTSASQDFNL